MAKHLNATGHFGLLMLRIGLGIMFIFHGFPKLIGGPEKWRMLGSVLHDFSIDFMPVVWGFMAGFAETIGGVLVIIGFWFRPATLMLFITMFVATYSHIKGGDSFIIYSHALEMAIVFFALTFSGPGRYALDNEDEPQITEQKKL